LRPSLKRGAKPGASCAFDLPPYDPHDEEHEATEADWFAQEYEPTRVTLRPLGAAVHMGHADAARLLLHAGADPNADADGGPPIFHATRRGYAKVVELLIERGADCTCGMCLGTRSSIRSPAAITPSLPRCFSAPAPIRTSSTAAATRR
jgi:ankyrin repeat protein